MGVSFVEGSFLEEGQLPAGADAYLLKHILHDWSDEVSECVIETNEFVCVIFSECIGRRGVSNMSECIILVSG